MTADVMGYYSFLAMVTSAVIYLVAFAAFSAEWASARNLDAGGHEPDAARESADRLRVDKYFPPVSRIDGAFGDRNLVCSCPPPEAFAE